VVCTTDNPGAFEIDFEFSIGAARRQHRIVRFRSKKKKTTVGRDDPPAANFRVPVCYDTVAGVRADGDDQTPSAARILDAEIFPFSSAALLAQF